MMAQSIILAKRPHLVVGTPGRLVDHLQNTKGFSVRGVKYLVLDEADKLLNMDFERELDIIVGACPRERNTFLFSATMTSKVKKLQRASLSNPVKVEVSSKYQASLASSVSLPHHVPSLSLTTFLSLSLQVALSLSPSLSLSHTAPLILRPPPFLRFSLCMPPPIYPICTFPYVLSHMYSPNRLLHLKQTVRTLVQQYAFMPAKHKDCYLTYILNELAGHTPNTPNPTPKPPPNPPTSPPTPP